MKNLNIFSLITEYENAKSGGTLITPNVSFVDEDSSVKYLLKLDFTHNGYEYVNLGLPSGLKWATCNVGATSPEQTGLYFAWGETTGYTGEQVPGVRAFDKASYTGFGISANLTLEQDAAHVNMGGNWRMPTEAECQELFDNCNVAWTDNYNGTGVAGKVFTSKVNGNSVFLPAAGCGDDSSVYSVGKAGYYWSASWERSFKTGIPFVYLFYFDDNNLFMKDREGYYGCSVRAVCE